MKFIFEEPLKSGPPTYADVHIDQFFVYKGRLCQRVTSTYAQTITDDQGIPCAAVKYLPMDNTTPIDRVLPRVVRIEY